MYRHYRWCWVGMGGVCKIQPLFNPPNWFFVAADVDGNASGGIKGIDCEVLYACVKSIAVDSSYWRRTTLCWYLQQQKISFSFTKNDMTVFKKKFCFQNC